MTEITSLMIFLEIAFWIIFLIGTPFIGALILSLFTQWFKFKKTDYKTALYSVLIVFGIMIAIIGALSMLFLDKIMEWQTIFTILALLISFFAGFFIVYKFYKETPLKCFGVWVLTCITGIVMYIIIVIIIALIFGQFI